MINGIIEYDHKLISLKRFLMIQQISQEENYWNTILICTLIYYTISSLWLLILWPPNTINMYIIGMYFIRIEFIMDITVIYSSYFFLQQLEYKFQTLNDSWEYLLPGFLAVPGELTHSITGMTLDKIRLLHSELSDLLRLFSVGYGKILLGFFVFSYINILLNFYFSIHFYFMISEEIIIYRNVLRNLVPHMINLQKVILVLAIIIAESRVHEKVTLIQIFNYKYLYVYFKIIYNFIN